jgi:hypothetical protein
MLPIHQWQPSFTRLGTGDGHLPACATAIRARSAAVRKFCVSREDQVVWGSDGIVLGATTFAGVVLVTRYVCASCGFSEDWVDERADLEKLSRKYNG